MAKKEISLNDLVGLSYEEINQKLAQTGNYIQFVESPTEEQIEIALKQNGYAIRHICNPYHSSDLFSLMININNLF